LVHDARKKGARVPIHIFPKKLTPEGLASLSSSTSDERLLAFWRSLGPIYVRFEETHRVPRVTVDAKGAYVLK
jgi:hypothetical protein